MASYTVRYRAVLLMVAIPFFSWMVMPEYPKHQFTWLPVEEQSWPSDYRVEVHKQFASVIAQERKPVVFRDALSLFSWRAKDSRWTPEKLLRVAGKQELPGSYKQLAGLGDFRYYNDKPIKPEGRRQYKEVDVTVSELLTDIKAKKHEVFFSGRIDFLGESLTAEVQPWDFLFVEPESDEDADTDAGRREMNVWLGGKGAVSHTHYDTAHNFYVQLYGRKRFTLLAPSEDPVPFPSLHTFYRQAHANIQRPEWHRFPRLQGAKVYQVTLGPGDMLYLPPFWWHRVESLRPTKHAVYPMSLSVNVWSDSKEYRISEKIFTAAVPFEESWSGRKRVQAWRTYIEMVLEGIHVSSQKSARTMNAAQAEIIAQDYIRERLIDGRWRGVNGGSHNFPKPLKERNCAVSASDRAAMRKDFKRGFNVVVPLFMQLPEGVRDIYVGNFIEQLADWAVGHRDVQSILYSCFGRKRH
eukprot:GFYU01003795.1.p1 GENE.GFYU01003795.1~~GFYU01003795.1.p1  ORF type:complete len:467 (-),score=58.57 GFYU01003795.1:24-1424(-)